MISTEGKTVRDGKRKQATTINAADVKSAIPTDPAHCAIAQSMRRRGGIESISIGASIVYVVWTERPDVVERYVLSPNDRAMIREFDKQGAFPCGYRVTLLPPPKHRRLGARKGERQGSPSKHPGTSKNALARAKKSTAPTRHVASPA